MRILKPYKLFLEAQSQVQAQNDLEKPKTIYKPSNLVTEICVAMVILNNEFLDNLLDRGLKARYSENSHVFLTDLKNLLFKNNRLHLGIFNQEGKCQSDDELSKMNGIFNEVEFNMEEDWDQLVNARIIARNIMDKTLPDDKLTEDLIKKVYWIGPNKTKENNEDIVVELNDGTQLSFFLNKALSMSKSASFNTFADDFIGQGVEDLHNEEDYIPKWNKLIQEWIRIIYENANKNIQVHIEKFIDPKKMESIGWFEYFDLKHRDFRFKNLGEHIKEFDKNILDLSELMKEIWKNRDKCFMDPERVYTEWTEKKIYILNSKILEHLFTESITSNSIDDVKRLDDGWKLASGTIKMKLMKTLVEKLGCLERPVFYLGNKGNSFHQVPSRTFFRDNYDDISIKFDYHVKMILDEKDEENNDFVVKTIIELNNKHLMDMNIHVRFTGGDVSSKLTSNYKFKPVDKFNLLVSNKMTGSSNEEAEEI
jgi:hypothetical protein